MRGVASGYAEEPNPFAPNNKTSYFLYDKIQLAEQLD